MAGTKEAETAKLLENTYRHVNIALVNEMARFCHDLDIDIWEVIRGAATKPFGFQKFTPGPGVGGHCIPIDPNYLSYQVKKTLGYPFHFVELAQEINSSMPSYVATRVADLLNEQGKALNGANILLLGVTYKPNIADQRESPAQPVAKALQDKKADVAFHDPTWTPGIWTPAPWPGCKTSTPRSRRPTSSSCFSPTSPMTSRTSPPRPKLCSTPAAPSRARASRGSEAPLLDWHTFRTGSVSDSGAR